MTIRMIMTSAVAVLALGACANDTMMEKPAAQTTVSGSAAGPNEASGISSGAGEIGGSDAGTVGAAPDRQSVNVGGAAMLPSRTIVENASEASNLTTLVAAVQAAELVDTLASPGPFTVFAPVNSAFDALPPGTVDTLLKPENKADLQGVLTYHVLSGTYDEDALRAAKGSSLSATLPTVQGGNLTVSAAGETLYVIDAKGNAARIIQSDVYQSNGVVHVIDAVLLP